MFYSYVLLWSLDVCVIYRLCAIFNVFIYFLLPYMYLKHNTAYPSAPDKKG